LAADLETRVVELIENILGIYINQLLKEGQNFLKLKTATITLQAIRGIRQVALMMYFAFLFFTLFTAGIFIIATQLVNQLQQRGVIYLDTALVIGIVITFLSGLWLFWGLREQRLIEAFALQKLISKLDTTPALSTATEHPPDKFDQRELNHLIDSMIEKRLTTLINERLNKSQPPPLRQSKESSTTPLQ